MILAALNDYYARLVVDPESGISKPGYSLEKISYAIVLNTEGSVVAVDDIRDLSGKKPVPRKLVVPQGEKRTSGLKSNFLWDKTSYVLGMSGDERSLQRLDELQVKAELSDDEKKEKEKLRKGREVFEKAVKRLPAENREFKDFHLEVLKQTQDEGLLALLRFVETWDSEQFSKLAAFSVHGSGLLDTNVVFRIDGEKRWLHERPEAVALLDRITNDGGDIDTGRCLVTGEQARVARLHPSIKGVDGAQSSGASIVSFNLQAFASYGKEQGANAPVSNEVAFAYTTTLNHLLRHDDHNRQRLQIGDATVVFWARGSEASDAAAAEDLFAEFLDPRDEDAQKTGRLHDALEAVRQGRPLSNLSDQLDDSIQIFVLGLAPNASRLSIRFWETGTLRMFAERLAAHYDDLDLRPTPWNKPPSIRWLVKVTGPYRKKGQNGEYDEGAVSPLLAGELTRAVLSGARYPFSLLGNLVMRMRADGEVSGVRVALIKAVLVRARRLGQKINHEGGIPVSLDTNNADPGYLLGRLFSLLENIQWTALGKQINATIRDRYYGAASATPASVFPVLIRSAQHHLSRLRKDKPGFAVNLEKELGEIFDMLGTAFPRSLGMEAQGHFAIGYYHQTKARFAGRNAQDDSKESIEAQGDNA